MKFRFSHLRPLSFQGHGHHLYANGKSRHNYAIVTFKGKPVKFKTFTGPPVGLLLFSNFLDRLFEMN